MSYGEWDLWGRAQGVGLIGWVNRRPMVYTSPYGMASGGQEEPFSRLDKAVYCDESSYKDSAHSCSNFGGKIQNGVPANS